MTLQLTPPLTPFCVSFSRLPSDKSIAQRALIFSLFTRGEVLLSGFEGGEDAQGVLEALRDLGKIVTQTGDVVSIRGAITAPRGPLDLKNSGTGTRLLSGALSGFEGEFELIGDASLSRRPMRRIIGPLRALGVDIRGENNRLPLKIHGRKRSPSSENLLIQMSLPSAQVHACLTLACLGRPFRIIAPNDMRDHTERMLRHFNLHPRVLSGPHRRSLSLEALSLPLSGNYAVDIPPDPSSAAFWAAGALLSPQSRVVIERVGLNPSRLGFVRLFERMGACITLRRLNDENAFEPVGRMVISGASGLRGISIDAKEAAESIDELVIWSLVAAVADGVSVLRGARELRSKECDRIRLMAETLRAFGVPVEEYPDGLQITGIGRSGTFNTPRGPLQNAHDHRIAMMQSLGVLRTKASILIDHPESAGVSYPRFFEDLKALGVRLKSVHHE